MCMTLALVPKWGETGRFQASRAFISALWLNHQSIDNSHFILIVAILLRRLRFRCYFGGSLSCMTYCIYVCCVYLIS